MKKFVLTVAAVLFAFMLTSDLAAKNAPVRSGSPAAAVKTFYSAMAKSDFVVARKYVVADEMKKMIEFLEKMTKEVPSLKEDTKKDFTPLANAKIISEKITGKKAEVKYSYTKDKKTKTETLNLQKVKGSWLII